MVLQSIISSFKSEDRCGRPRSCLRGIRSFPLVDCPSGHDGLEHGALLIQEHEVGVATDGDSPFAIQDHCRRGSLCSHAYSLGEGDTQEPDGVSYGLVHGECATSERPVGKPDRTIFQANLASP
jgi:hypothetical protein